MEIIKEKMSPGHSIRVNSTDLQNLFNLTNQLLITKNLLIESPEIQKIQEPKLRYGLLELDKLIRKMEESTLNLRLSPIKGLFLKTHRMVVEISKKFNKPVDLQFEGEETKLDREVLDFLSDIFPHLIRNSIDHAIESGKERVAIGKKETATIFVKASNRGREVIIEFTDDGKGIDKKRVIEKAIEKKIFDPNTNFDLIPDDQIYALLFLPGFSTTKKITDISGRGVGLEVAKSTIERLRGKIEVRSTINKGTSFIFTLPINTAIMDVLVTEINKIPYLVSLIDIDKIYLYNEVSIYSVPTSKRFLVLQNKIVPLIELGNIFPGAGRGVLGKEVIITFLDQGRIYAILVDDLIFQTQIVLNPLPSNLVGKENFITGSALLSTGEVSHLLDLSALVESHLRTK